MTDSMFKIGQWCLSLYQSHGKQLQTPEQCKQFEQLLEFLLVKGFDLIDCDKPQIGRPLLQFYTHWV